MNDIPAPPTKGRPPPILVLCRQCVEYVFAGTDICPHCGGNAREIGPRYRDGCYEPIEAIQRIEHALRRRTG